LILLSLEARERELLDLDFEAAREAVVDETAGVDSQIVEIQVRIIVTHDILLGV